MDFLKAEIARKRKDIEKSSIQKAQQDTPGGASGTSQKFFRRGDLEKIREDEYLKKQVEKEKQQAEHAAKQPSKRQRKDKQEEEEPQTVLGKDEVFRRLRRRGEPVILFGETFEETRARLHNIELKAPDVITERQRNEFMEAMESVDQEYVKELLAKKSATGYGDKVKKHTIYSWEEMNEWAARLMKRKPKSEWRKDLIVVRKILKNMLRMWDESLSGRSDQEKRTAEGVRASATFKQTETYMKPLFKVLKEKGGEEELLENDIKICVKEVVYWVLKREYIKANDMYLKMAIGNAAWPIGVTNVGIHSRTGREKIFSQYVAHVLNDETQRKYIQGLKRLMTFCQNKFPAEPSKCLEHNGADPNYYGAQAIQKPPPKS